MYEREIVRKSARTNANGEFHPEPRISMLAPGQLRVNN